VTAVPAEKLGRAPPDAAELLLSAALTCVLLLTFTGTLIIRFPPVWLFFPIFAFHGAAAYAPRNVKMPLVFVLVGTPLLFAAIALRRGELLPIIDGFMTWLGGADDYNAPMYAAYRAVSAAALALALSVPVYLLVRVRVNTAILTTLGFSVFVGRYLLLREDPYFLFYVFLFLVLVYDVKKRLPPGKPAAVAALCAVPLAAVISVTTLAAPHREEPLINDIAAAFARLTGGIGTPSGDGILDLPIFSFDGAAGEESAIDTELGGAINPSGSVRLYLSGTRAAYLRGRTASVYTGRRWETESRARAYPYTNPFALPDGGVYSLDILTDFGLTDDVYNAALTYQIPFMLDLLRGGAVSDYVTTPPSIAEDGERALYTLSRATVYHWNISTFTAFLPSCFADFRRGSNGLDNPFYRSVTGDITAREKMGKEYNYGVVFLQYNLTREQWDDLLDMSYEGFSWSITQDGDPHDRVTERMLNAMRDDALAARENYLNLPRSLPGRVGELALALTENEPTDYRKARAIEKYLSENFPYTTETPLTPQGEDFVDFFLFELREGYCVYFASAMTVLCRAAGIPARYAEGFAVGSDRIEGYYYATGREAHAWTEVYLDGFGWVQFEPTSGFTADFYNNYRNYYRPGTSPSDAPQEPTESVTPPTGTYTPSLSPSLPPPGGSTLSDYLLAAARFWPVLPPALWLLYLYIRRRRYVASLKNLSFSKDIAYRYCRHMLRNLRFFDLRQVAGETPLEFFIRCEGRLYASRGQMPALADAYNELRYGEAELSAARAGAVRDAVLAVEACLEEKLGKTVLRVLRNVAGVVR
jgi:transglutaminase-like putative cysteine protease